MRYQYATGRLLPKPKPTNTISIYLASVALLLTTMCLYARAQEILHIRGTVMDSVTREPLPGTIVKVKNTGIYVRTNELGHFSLRGAHIHAGVLEVSNSNYLPVTVNFGPDSKGPFAILMAARLHRLEEVEVVSTGFYRVPKERATGSFVHVGNRLLSRGVGSNVLDRLEGVTRGLIFNKANMGGTRFNNQPSISIRGRSTLFANAEPLIILDNFPYEGDVNAINPEDIESVTILQDAAAASIWGARAGNGVIVLTSKKGRLGQPLSVSVRGDWSIGQKPDLYYASTIPIPEYIELERFLFDQGAWNGRINQVYPYITPAIEVMLAHRNGHIDSLEMESRLARLKTRDVRRDLSNHIYRPTALYKAALNFQGGGTNNSYYFSAGYDKNIANIRNNHNDRISLQARNSYRFLHNRLSADAVILFSTAKSAVAGQNLNYYQVLYDRLVDESGHPASIGGGMNISALRQSYIDTAGYGILQDWAYRPLEELDFNTGRTTNENFQLQTNLTYQLLPGLAASASYRYLNEQMTVERITDASSFFVRHEINRFSQIDPLIGTVTSAMPNGGRLGQSAQRIASHHFRANLNFTKEWEGKHGVSVLAGWEVNRREGLSETDADRWGYDPETESHTPIIAGNYRQYHTGSLTALPVTYGLRERTDNRNILYFGNASYTFESKYTATFSARKDEANIFGAEVNRRGRPFWSAGLLWRIDKEGFFPAASKLALRLTHGYTGNVSNTSAYTTSRINGNPDTRTGRIYQVITTPPNPQLGWENVMMTNVALEFAVFRGRLSGTVEHYRKKATDLLSNAPIHPSSGVSSLYGNWSSLRGNGWDMNLTSQNLDGNVRWQSDLIISYADEKVTEYKLRPASDRDYLASNLGNYPIEGKPMYALFSLPWAGLDGDGNPQGYLDGQLSKDYTALYNNTGLSGYVYHGRATPSLFGGFRNTLHFAGLELSVNITYEFGFYFRRPGISYSTLYNPTNYAAGIFQFDYMNRWRNPGDEAITHVPRAAYPAQAAMDSFYGRSAVLVERGDHIRLQDIRLAYRIGNAPRYGIQALQFYVYTSNLGILWRANKLGIDPEAVPDQQLVFPAQRSFSLGVDFKF